MSIFSQGVADSHRGGGSPSVATGVMYVPAPNLHSGGLGTCRFAPPIVAAGKLRGIGSKGGGGVSCPFDVVAR